MMTLLDGWRYSQSARALGPGLEALAAWMLSQNYSQHCRETVVMHTSREGTPSGCPELDPEDEATATEVFVDALPAGHPSDPAWDRPAVAAGALATGCLVPPELEDDAERVDWILSAWEAQHEETLRSLAAAPGPSGEPAPYEPTAEDLADYERWLREHEPLGEPDLWADAPDSPPIAGRSDRIDQAAQRRWDAEILGEWPRISGGSPEADRCEPTAEDLDDYHAAARTADVLDALRRDEDGRHEADRYRGR